MNTNAKIAVSFQKNSSWVVRAVRTFTATVVVAQELTEFYQPPHYCQKAHPRKAVIPVVGRRKGAIHHLVHLGAPVAEICHNPFSEPATGKKC